MFIQCLIGAKLNSSLKLYLITFLFIIFELYNTLKI